MSDRVDMKAIAHNIEQYGYSELHGPNLDTYGVSDYVASLQLDKNQVQALQRQLAIDSWKPNKLPTATLGLDDNGKITAITFKPSMLFDWSANASMVATGVSDHVATMEEISSRPGMGGSPMF